MGEVNKMEHLLGWRKNVLQQLRVATIQSNQSSEDFWVGTGLIKGNTRDEERGSRSRRLRSLSLRMRTAA